MVPSCRAPPSSPKTMSLWSDTWLSVCTLEP
jgi:hypothetical protein